MWTSPLLGRSQGPPMAKVLSWSTHGEWPRKWSVDVHIDGRANGHRRGDVDIAVGIGHLYRVGRRSSQGRPCFRCNSMVIPALAGSPRGQRPVANRRSQAQAFNHRFRDIGAEWPIPTAMWTSPLLGRTHGVLYGAPMALQLRMAMRTERRCPHRRVGFGH